MKKNNYQFWKLPLWKDRRGCLCTIELKSLPFKARRLYFVFNVNGLRGGHAHRSEEELFVCISGSFRAVIHDGERLRRFTMNKAGQALFTSRMVWHEFDSFTKDAVMLAVSSTAYTGTDGYIIDFEKFKRLCKKKFS